VGTDQPTTQTKEIVMNPTTFLKIMSLASLAALGAYAYMAIIIIHLD
jgi:hypothetical protein